MFFGGGEEKQKGKTVVLLDVGSGSVAAALVQLLPEHQPKIFGALRKSLPLAHSVSAPALARAVASAAREALNHTSAVAARIRGHDKLSHVGEVARADIFLSPPWTTLEDNWQHEEALTAPLAVAVEEYFGEIPASLHPFGRALASVSNSIFPEEKTLIAVVNGEVTELLLVHNGNIVGRATTPLGHHLLLRTLRAHGGFTEAEARSALLVQPSHIEESLSSTAAHFTREFRDVARDLLADPSAGGPARSVYVVAHEPAGEWFAKALGGEALQDLFPEGGMVRALRAHHLTPYVGAHARPDLFLMLQTIFVDLPAGRQVAAS